MGLGKLSYASVWDKPPESEALLATCLLEIAPLGLTFPICKTEGSDPHLLEVLWGEKPFHWNKTGTCTSSLPLGQGVDGC